MLNPLLRSSFELLSENHRPAATSRRPILCAALLLALVIAPEAGAQPTGNPKGTPAPVTGDADKAPAGSASRSNGGGSPDSGKLFTDRGPVEARTHTNRGPGTGTAGGLPKKTPQDGGRPSGRDAEGGSQNRPVSRDK